MLFITGCITPVLFSHVVSFTGVVFWEPGYESLKQIFLAVSCIWVGGILIQKKRLYVSRLNLLLGGFLIAIFILQSITTGSISSVISGDTLFHYWAAYVFLIYILFCMVRCLNKQEIDSLILGFLFSSIPVYVYALIQFLGYDFLKYDASFDLSRAFSTLWNPALLAFYALGIHIIARTKNFSHFLVYPLTAGIIIATQTWWAMILLGSYWVYEFSFLKWLSFRKRLCIFLLTTVVVSVAVAAIYIYKPGTFTLRFAILHDALSYFFAHPLAWYIWFSAQEINTLYSQHMNWARTFTDPRYAIGHTHNIFVEIILRLWVLVSGLIATIIALYYRSISASQKSKICALCIVFIAMASVHMPEIIVFFMFASILRFLELNGVSKIL